jgi:hypothetical protein
MYSLKMAELNTEFRSCFEVLCIKYMLYLMDAYRLFECREANIDAFFCACVYVCVCFCYAAADIYAMFFSLFLLYDDT